MTNDTTLISTITAAALRNVTNAWGDILVYAGETLCDWEIEHSAADMAAPTEYCAELINDFDDENTYWTIETRAV